MENLPEHSPLGASGAERWMHCAGSVALLKKLSLPESDEPDYRKEGTAAHEAAAKCLTDNLDGWEVVNQTFNGVEITPEIANGVQLYLDTVRPLIQQSTLKFVEYRISSPAHPLFYGRVDLGLVFQDEAILDITDYKNGAGITVDVEWNPQIMYYAYGFLQDFPGLRKVRLRIVQPNGFHPDGPVREWEIDADSLCEWAEKVLIPAMVQTELDNDLNPGKWCRFCPAKLVCPVLTSLFGAAMKANPAHVVNLSNESLGRSYQYLEGVKFYIKALEDETFRRKNNGQDVPEVKLVWKKANRVYRPGAKEVIIAQFGDDAMTKPELKSPAEIEKIGPKAKDLVKEWAYQPQTGLTIAPSSDKRPEAKPRLASEAFPNALTTATTEQPNG